VRARRRERIAPPFDPDQMIIAGVQPVSLGQRLTWAAQQPMQPKRAQHPLDVGFWDPMRNQLEMFWPEE
jgi:hypothetical protein